MSILKSQTLNHWLDLAAAKATLIAPRDVDGILLYRPVSNSHQIVWDYVRPVLSAKEVVFPPTERLLKIEKTGQTIHLIDINTDDQKILFGVRPCDARGIKALDALFIETEPKDLNYAQRRENTIIVGMACKEMGETCFCTSVGGAPDDPSGMDVMLKAVEGGYEVYAITDKGLQIVKGEWGIDNCEQETPRSQFTTHNSALKLPDRESWPPQFNDDFWADMSERCLSCRICAYVCPTCRCFDVRDEAITSDNEHQTFERIRCWDSCAGEVYRRIAGGHNPRAEKGQRLRNRFFCKFYYYPEQYHIEACTGCGRCIDSCPVNIDITEVLEYVGSGEVTGSTGQSG